MGLFSQFFYKRRKFYDDDFDWDNYTSDSYYRRLKGDIESKFRAISMRGQLGFDAETGTVSSQVEPIHPNSQLILEIMGQLAPTTAHEVGCGGGDHVANATTLFPEITVTGGDRSTTQLDLALERHPTLKGQVGLQDITMPFSDQWPQAELVYSQAVIMLIHTAVSHLVAIANMVRGAQKYVLLVENTQCHNFVHDIQALFDGGHLGWDTLYIHQVTGSTGARGILLAKTPLDYPKLHSDVQIREDVAPSARRLKRADEDSARGLFGFPRR